MPAPRSVSVQKMEEAIEAMRLAREQLRVTERAYRRGISKIDSGADIGDALETIAAPSIRVTLNEALDNLEHSRHQARLAVVVAALDEGLSLGQIGKRIGVSRQLAARFAKEARAGGAG